ncbi:MULTISPECIES: hypothetical protein [unclassified Streptomyces]|uniref:hypothetical protein n=1 Tax=unclassified Streptomyces TaxID=2593676 RepID=UPI003369C955
MDTMTGLRLLPWRSPDGKPSYLASDGDQSHLNARADMIESLQLSMGTELLAHARALLEDRKADAAELRFLAKCLCEALRDVLRVAESRGRRLTPYEEVGAEEPTDAPATESGGDPS